MKYWRKTVVKSWANCLLTRTVFKIGKHILVKDVCYTLIFSGFYTIACQKGKLNGCCGWRAHKWSRKMLVDLGSFILQGLCYATLRFVDPANDLAAKIISILLGFSFCTATRHLAPLVIWAWVIAMARSLGLTCLKWLKLRTKLSPCICR